MDAEDGTLQGTITYPAKREVRTIIDSKVPAGRGYVSFQEGNSFEKYCICMVNWNIHVEFPG